MIAMKIIDSILLSTILIAILSCTVTTAFTENRITYSIKFVCMPPLGPDNEAEFVSQPYKTVINIQNPNLNQTAYVEKKAVIAQSEDKDRGLISANVTDSLRSNEALSINCNDISSLFNSTMPIGDGFVILKSNLKLGVSAVYTTQGSIDVEYIQPFQPRM